MKFAWSEECQAAFEQMKGLGLAPMLAFPNLLTPMCLNTDASAIGLGVVLSQCGEDGQERVLGFTSHMLTCPEIHGLHQS